MTDKKTNGNDEKSVDCRVFQDQLDAMVEGTLPLEGMRQMRLHAEGCPECAMELRVKEHLALPSLAELEKRVPDEMVTSMWGRVSSEVGSTGLGTADDRLEGEKPSEGAPPAAGVWRAGESPEGSHPAQVADHHPEGPHPAQVADHRPAGSHPVPVGGHHPEGPHPAPVGGHPPGGSGEGKVAEGVPSRPFGWLVPLLTAATVVLLFATGFLFWETRQLRIREDLLAQQVVEQRRWLAELDVSASADPVARTAALAGRDPWVRALSRRDDISFGGLRTLLERMPPDRILVEADRLRSLRTGPAPLLPPLLRGALAEMETGAGLRVRDLLRALETMDMSPGTTVPTSELLDLVS